MASSPHSLHLLRVTTFESKNVKSSMDSAGRCETIIENDVSAQLYSNIYQEEHGMPRAIDFHVHLPTTEFMQVSLGPYAKAAERFFRTEIKLKEIEQLAADYAELDIIGVLLAWDAETATGLPPLSNDYVAEVVKRFPQQFVGFASVDP